MTQTMNEREIAHHAQVTLATLEDRSPAAYLQLIEHSKTELEALEAGMHGQAGEQLAAQNRAWSAQFQAQALMVEAALAAGVPSDAIRAITWRES